MEDAYVAVLCALHADAGAPALTCKAVDVVGPAPDSLPDDPTRPALATLEEGTTITAETLAAVVRGCLREMVWCRLESTSCSIAFGYDYYTYWLGELPSPTTLALVKERGLFLEPNSAPAFDPI